MATTNSHPVLTLSSANIIISKLLCPTTSSSDLYIRPDDPQLGSFLKDIHNLHGTLITDIIRYYHKHTRSILLGDINLNLSFRYMLYCAAVMPRNIFPSFFDACLRSFGVHHFSYHEFFPKSKTQPFGYCGRILAMRYIVIAIIMESIRDSYSCPLRITSGYRPAAYNTSVGGSVNSYHTRYRAVDFVPLSSEITADILNNPSSFNLLVQQFDPVEVIFGKNYIHLAF